MKYALLTASNYVNSRNQLAGCINDVTLMRERLEKAGVEIFADLRDSDLTTGNWKDALRGIAKKGKSGDVIFSMYSGHGTTMRSIDGMGFDECYCPDDFDGSDAHVIRDDYMAAVLNELEVGVKWIQWSDCCHAGGSLRDLWCNNESPKYIYNPDAQKLFGMNFGNDRPKFNPMLVTGDNYKGVGLFACQSTQTSADAFIDGIPCGAFSHYFMKAMDETPMATYENLMLRATNLLGLNGYNQKPELYCKTGVEHDIFSKDVLNA